MPHLHPHHYVYGRHHDHREISKSSLDNVPASSVPTGARLMLHLFLPVFASQPVFVNVVANTRQIGRAFIMGGPNDEVAIATGPGLHRLLDVTRAYHAFLGKPDAQPVQLSFTTTKSPADDAPRATLLSAYFEWICS